MNRVITIDFTQSGIDKAIKEVEEAEKLLYFAASKILTTLALKGYDKASLKFKDVTYAGDIGHIDLSVSVNLDEGTAEVRASGETVLFIEFGTGIKYENPHMENYGFFAGSYGKGQGNNPQGWWYAGTPQSNDPPDTEIALRFDKNKNPTKERPGWMHTYGSPANMPMYQTQKELEDELTQIVREALNDK